MYSVEWINVKKVQQKSAWRAMKFTYVWMLHFICIFLIITPDYDLRIDRVCEPILPKSKFCHYWKTAERWYPPSIPMFFLLLLEPLVKNFLSKRLQLHQTSLSYVKCRIWRLSAWFSPCLRPQWHNCPVNDFRRVDIYPLLTMLTKLLIIKT